MSYCKNHSKPFPQIFSPKFFSKIKNFNFQNPFFFHNYSQHVLRIIFLPISMFFLKTHFLTENHSGKKTSNFFLMISKIDKNRLSKNRKLLVFFLFFHFPKNHFIFYSFFSTFFNVIII